MAQIQSELRIFVSSTFHDLQEEREYLVKKVFPEIRQLCRERGVEFTEIDLRWGLTEEEATHGKIIRTCLEEIDRCRPYFIGIIGDRYGWSPKFHDVQKDGELIRKYPWIEDMSAESASIIDMEFEYAVLQNPSQAYGSYFYFRKNNSQEKHPDAKKLDGLKKRIRQSKRPVKEFETPKDLGEMVRADLSKLVQMHWHKDAEESPLEIERASHDAFASTRRRAYILNPEYLRVFNEFVESKKTGLPLVISGLSGIGKSSLMAYLAHTYRRRHPDSFVIEHYIGSSTSTSDHSGLLRHICLEIKDRLSLEEEIPQSTEDLTREFPNWLAKIQAEKLTIFIDALNQLEGNSVYLNWLPSFIPENISVICSATEGESLTVLREHKAPELELHNLDAEEREAIIVRFLGEYHKGLSGAQSRRIAADSKSSSPLFLRTLLEELRLVGNFEKIDEKIDHYLAAEDLDDLFRRVLERIEQDYVPEFVESFMSLLWSARKGLSEAELLDLLADNSRTADDQPFNRLDLSLLLNALDFHLIRKDGLLSFFHVYLQDAVGMRYLSGGMKQRQLHHKLGKYFATLPAGKRRADEEPWQWEKSESWKDFSKCLTDIPLLERLLEEDKLYEIIRYWVTLRDHADPPDEYRKAINHYESETTDKERLANLCAKLGAAFNQAGYYEPAEQFLRNAVEIKEELYGKDHPNVAEMLNQLGEILIAKGDYTNADVLLDKILAIYQVAYGKKHIKTGEILQNMGLLNYKQGKFESAEHLWKNALTIFDAALGERHSKTIGAISDLASTFFAQQKFDDAEFYATRALQANEEKLGKDHPATATDKNNLATILIQKQDFLKADLFAKQALEINLRTYGMLHPETAYNYNTLGYLYNRMMRKELSIGYYSKALEINRKMKGDMHPETAKSMTNLARLYQENGSLEKASGLYLKSFEIRLDCWGKDNPDTLRSFERISNLYQTSPQEIKNNISQELRLIKNYSILESDNNYHSFLQEMG
jgi:nephrocystin-3